MDPVSHAVIGRVAVAAFVPGRPQDRGLAAAAVLGALSPDVDFVLMREWDTYLRWHVIGTHSLGGAVLTGLGSALLVRTLVRGSVLSRLCMAGTLAAVTHLAADIVSGARLQPGWPISSGIVSLPLVSMGDPWTILILAAGARALWRARPRLQGAARATLVALTMFLSFKWILLASVPLGGIASTTSSATGPVMEARWASLTEWFAYDRGDGVLRQWRLRAGGRGPELLLEVPEPPESALVRRSRGLDTVRNFLAVHELGFPTVQLEPSGRRAVLWSDVRFCWRSDAAPVSCALWFGGAFDGAGRPVTQEVRVGSWIQQRSP